MSIERGFSRVVVGTILIACGLSVMTKEAVAGINHATAYASATAGVQNSNFVGNSQTLSAPISASVSAYASDTVFPSNSTAFSSVNGNDPAHLITIGAGSNSLTGADTGEIDPMGDASGNYVDTLHISNPGGKIASAQVVATFSVALDFHFADLVSDNNTLGVGLVAIGQSTTNGVVTSEFDNGAGLTRRSGQTTTSLSNGAPPWDSLIYTSTGTDGLILGTFHFLINLTPDPILPNTLSGDWSVYERVFTSAQEGGSASIGLNDPPTFSFQSLTYANGTTPESQGYSVSFASGMPSPNASTTPEPSSIVLSTIAIVLTAAGHHFRKANHKPH